MSEILAPEIEQNSSRRELLREQLIPRDACADKTRTTTRKHRHNKHNQMAFCFKKFMSEIWASEIEQNWSRRELLRELLIPRDACADKTRTTTRKHRHKKHNQTMYLFREICV